MTHDLRQADVCCHEVTWYTNIVLTDKQFVKEQSLKASEKHFETVSKSMMWSTCTLSSGTPSVR